MSHLFIVDENQMRDNVVDSMIDGIDRSSLVLVFITAEYMNKVCGREKDNCNDAKSDKKERSGPKPKDMPSSADGSIKHDHLMLR